MSNPRYMCLDGDIVPFEDARVHVQTPAMRYAAMVFEGMRGWWNAEHEEMYLFRISDHLRRLRQSMKVMRFDADYSEDYLLDRLRELIRANDLRQDIHIRLSVFLVGDGEMDATGPIGFSIAALPKGRMVKEVGGIDCAVSSWSRISDNANPPRVKCAANYVNGRLALLQAKADGYDSTIILNPDGKVAEAPGACLFIIRDGTPATPAATQGILESVTRQTLLRLFDEYLDHPAVEREIDRTELYCAEEMFICGTGYQVLPVVSVDRLKVGDGEIGPLTSKLAETYVSITRGTVPDHPEWRTPTYGEG
jgi:branched-chain amino acid aminotransferase